MTVLLNKPIIAHERPVENAYWKEVSELYERYEKASRYLYSRWKPFIEEEKTKHKYE